MVVWHGHSSHLAGPGLSRFPVAAAHSVYLFVLRCIARCSDCAMQAPLVLHRGGHERRLQLSRVGDGYLQSADTGLFVHPQGGVGGMEVGLVFYPGACPGARNLRFRFVSP